MGPAAAVSGGWAAGAETAGAAPVADCATGAGVPDRPSSSATRFSNCSTRDKSARTNSAESEAVAGCAWTTAGESNSDRHTHIRKYFITTPSRGSLLQGFLRLHQAMLFSMSLSDDAKFQLGVEVNYVIRARLANP